MSVYRCADLSNLPKGQGPRSGCVSGPVGPRLTSAPAMEELPELSDAFSLPQVHRGSPGVAMSPGTWRASGLRATAAVLGASWSSSGGVRGAVLQLPTVVSSSGPSLPFPPSWSPARFLTGIEAHFPHRLTDSSPCSRLHFGEESELRHQSFPLPLPPPFLCPVSIDSRHLTLFIFFHHISETGVPSACVHTQSKPIWL